MCNIVEIKLISQYFIITRFYYLLTILQVSQLFCELQERNDIELARPNVKFRIKHNSYILINS